MSPRDLRRAPEKTINLERNSVDERTSRQVELIRALPGGIDGIVALEVNAVHR